MFKTQKYLYYLLFLITPFIMYSGTSELFEFNKMIYIYLITSSVLCVWIARMVSQGKFLFKRTPFDIPIALFFLSQVLSTLFSIDMHTSIFGYYGRFNGGLLSLISYLILYYNFVELFDDKKEELSRCIQNILKISVISSTLVILWGLPGRIGYDLSCLVFSGKLNNACWTAQFDPAARMFSTLGQPNWLGAYLAITFFVLLYYFFKASDKKEIRSHYLSYFGLLFLTLSAIFFTNSRSTIISVIAPMGPVFLWIFIKRKKLELPFLKIKLVLLLAGLLFCIVVLKTGINQIDRYLSLPQSKAPVVVQTKTQAPSSLFKVSESIDIRKIVWKGAVNLGLQYPLFGTGVETFAYSYYFVRPVEHNLTSEWDYLYNKAHNEYLNFFATTGVFGLSTYMLYIGAVIILGLYWSYRSASLLQLSLLVAWLTILISNFFGFSTTTINLYFYLIPALLYGLEIIKDSKNIQQKKLALKIENSNTIAYLAIGLFYVFLLQFFLTYWLADTKYAQSEIYAKTNDYQTAYTLLNRAIQLHGDHVYNDKLSFDLANLALIASYQKDAKLSEDLIKTSNTYNELALKESPQNILYWKTRIKNLYLFYQISLDKKYLTTGIEALSEAQKISPTDPKLPYFSATYFSLVFDEEKDPAIKDDLQKKSLDAIDLSLKLKSDYYESYYLKAQLLKKYKMKKQAKEVYEFILKNISPNNKQVQDELKGIQ